MENEFLEEGLNFGELSAIIKKVKTKKVFVKLPTEELLPLNLHNVSVSPLKQELCFNFYEEGEVATADIFDKVYREESKNNFWGIKGILTPKQHIGKCDVVFVYHQLHAKYEGAHSFNTYEANRYYAKEVIKNEDGDYEIYLY